MPCFSATNVRFHTPSCEQLRKQSSYGNLRQQQHHQQQPQDRSKSAYRLPTYLERMRGGGGGGTATASAGGAAAANGRLAFAPFQRRCEQFAAGDKKAEVRKAIQAQRNSTQKNQQQPKELFLKAADLKRLRDDIRVVTVEDRLRALERKDEEDRRMVEEAERLRAYYKEMDEERKSKLQQSSDQVDEIVAEKLDDKAKVLNRVFLARQEQEEEVKMVNRMIMDAKCHAVRDAQIQEKMMMAEELKNDEKRLQKMVNERAKTALSKEDADAQKEVEKRAKYAREIRQQLYERENLRFLEAERIEEEAKVSRRAAELIKQEEDRQRELIMERKRNFREELERLKEISAVFKKMLCEQERLADMRIVAYMKDKREKDLKLKNEKAVSKQEFERRQQRIYTLAEKAQQSKAANDEMAYLKEQNRMEREYRAKEKAAALHKREVERELLESRAAQAQDIKQRLALQIAHAEQDFNVLMERLKEEENKQKALDKERAVKRNAYRRDIVQQMTDKELERRRLVELERKRTCEWLENERQREQNIKSVINAKIRDMRENCLPERYIKDVEKQLNKIQANKSRIVKG